MRPLKLISLFALVTIGSGYAAESISQQTSFSIYNNNKKNATTAFPQKDTRTISGTIQDATGPITGANVIVKGTTHGTVTDLSGKFILEDIPANAILQISYIGYLSQEIEIRDQKTINILLKEDNQALDEVVVVGYGTVRKADLAGSVSVLDSKNFKDQPITQVSDALQGRVSGVQVQNSGVPGGAVKIRVRGSGSINRSNEPLYVIDGIVRESGLTGLNTEDIQSMQILKDASSTAIYGSRGSNGVVLITTKTGRADTKLITFDAQLGISNVAKRYDIMSPFEFASAFNDAFPNTFGSDQLGAFQNGTAGTDWQDAIYQTGLTQNYKMSLSNGNKSTQYYISANYMGQEGVVIENTNKRYQARANVTSEITNWLHLTADINASHNVRRNANFSASKSNIMWSMLNFSPVTEIQKEDGSYYRDSYCALLSDNPVGTLKENMGESITDIVNARLDLKFTILPGLTFTTTNGVDYSDAKGYSFSTKKVSTTNGLSNNDNYRMTLQTTNNFTYNNKWGKHALTATAVYEATTSEYRMMSISGNNLKTESGKWWNINMADSRREDNAYESWALASGVARVMYNYNDRYMVTGTFRADGSSKFFKDKWGFFPSIAAAWSLGNEKFMQQQNIIQNAKIRASYGLVGSQAISPYETLGLMKQEQYAFGGGSKYTGYWTGTNMPTPELSWETTHQFDLGVEFSVWDSRLNFSIDYFDKQTKDGLLKKAMPTYDGGGEYWVNAGEISNRGIDFTINANLLNTKDLSWNTTLNGSYLKNNVKSLSDIPFIKGASPAPGMIPTDGVTRIEVGQPIGSFYGYTWTGLDATGHDTYADLDGSGTVSSNDRTFIGKSAPTFTLGWNNSLTWRNWDLNVFFSASFGADRLNLMRFTGASMNGDSKFITLKEAYYDSFDKVGQSARYPSVKVTNNDYEAASTKWLESADYFRLENISLSYNLAKSVTKFADFRFSLSCQNLFTITGYKGMDPAGSSFMDSGVDVNDGIDIGAYPLPRTFTFGVRMNF
ncbi:MAG: TonB-dependent receptor [Tannerellaceae bacterium]